MIAANGAIAKKITLKPSCISSEDPAGQLRDRANTTLTMVLKAKTRPSANNTTT